MRQYDERVDLRGNLHQTGSSFMKYDRTFQRDHPIVKHTNTGHRIEINMQFFVRIDRLDWKISCFGLQENFAPCICEVFYFSL